MNDSTQAMPRITKLVQEVSNQQLAAYKANPTLVDEHANLERAMRQGSYGRRQLFELVQNGADPMLNHPGGRIVVRLTGDHLYCANEGAPIDDDGVKAILHSHLSVKRGNEIGRFGLGFKSVLGVTDKPEFHSKVGSFAFNAKTAAERIAKIVPGAEIFPTLRIANPIDSNQSMLGDPHLEELLEWATTVIRLPLTSDAHTWLNTGLAEFPSEFLLFCSHVSSLTLEDTINNLTRSISIERLDDFLVLHDGEESTQWKVFETTYSPSDAARAEAGELADRKTLPLIWAVPCSGRLRTGRFWAFFPLGDETTLSGILNAPWKTNDDRTNLLDGEFNNELIGVAAKLVVDNLPNVVTVDDPGRALDLLPARGRETRSWGDAVLTPATHQYATTHASIPDQTGTFRPPNELRLHPENIPPEALDLWSKQIDRPTNWVHPSVETRERRARTSQIYDRVGQSAESLEDWLLALEIDSSKVVSLKPCIRVAAKIAELAEHSEEIPLQKLRQSLSTCAIVADSEGKAYPLDKNSIFLPGEHQMVSEHIQLVHIDLRKDPEIVECLESLGIHPVTPELELSSLIHKGFAGWVDGDWIPFWQLVRTVDRTAAAEQLRGHPILVMTVSGEFRQLRMTLLPGRIVPQDGSRDASVAIDRDFHTSEIGLLSDIGAAEAPMDGCSLQKESYRKFTHEQFQQYSNSLSTSSKPVYDYLSFSKNEYAGPLEPYALLSDEGKAAFTESLDGQKGFLDIWNIGHDTRGDVYPAAKCESPELWAIRRWGVFNTPVGLRKVEQCVSPRLSQWSSFVPVAESSDELAEALELRDSLDDLGETDWNNAFDRAFQIFDDDRLGKFYSAACNHGSPIPATMHCRVNETHGRVLPASVTVSVTPSDFSALCDGGIPCIRVSEETDADALVSNWGMRPAAESVQSELHTVAASDPIPLLDFFPALRFHDAEGKLTRFELIECSELRHETVTDAGKTSRAESFSIRGNSIHWQSDLSVENLLLEIDDRLNLQLGPTQRDKIVLQHANQERQQRIVEIRRLKTNPEKLLSCIGVDEIRPRIPTGLIKAVEVEYGNLTDVQLADLAFTVYGPDTLHEYRDEFGIAGFSVPLKWAGSQSARKFVRDLGFERPFAGYEQPRRPGLVTVDGPITLPDLHEYQRKIVDETHQLILGIKSDRRGMISLPTGAGKTRVAVQAVVELIRDEKLGGPVLWVAQSDELCEQAVQTWREVWRSIGGQYQLSISRLWSNNNVESIEDGVQVAVATIQKLNGCIGNSAYTWLRDATIVIIDEAHGAIAKTYTQLLKWQEISGKQTRCPLIGLTATPFRGRSEEQTERLAGRFGRRRLDRGLGDDPYQYLQSIKVLANVEHKLLQGAKVVLGKDELAELKKFQNVPSTVNERLGADAVRNRTLLTDITNLDRNWPVLLFAASVEHAQTMAALLRMAGVSAAPISADTAPGARRTTIEEFRAGKIQVLTNFRVLTQGFDAPAVRVIYVARPTFSPNLYQQMIGRGLRGPLNGGKEICRIVNVQDTFSEFGESLAFHEFEYLWGKQSK